MKKPVLLLLLLSLIAAVPVLHAHGGGEIQIANAAVGPYTMTVWLNPPQPRTGETIHITVGLAEPPQFAPMLDAEVMVEITAVSEQRLVLTTPATTAASVNKLFYETDFTLDEAGDFNVLLNVNGPDGGGEAAFTMSLSSANRTNWLFIGLAALVGIAGVSLFRNRNVG